MEDGLRIFKIKRRKNKKIQKATEVQLIYFYFVSTEKTSAYWKKMLTDYDFTRC